MAVSRRGFVGGFAAALGYLGVGPETDLFALTRDSAARWRRRLVPQRQDQEGDGGIRRRRQAVEQREPVRAARVGDEGDDRRLQVRQPLRQPGRRHHRRDCRAPRREARERAHRRRLERDPRHLRRDLPAGRPQGDRRRADLRDDLPVRDRHEVRGDQDSAPSRLPPGHPRDDPRGQEQLPRRRARLPLQPEQPDRRRRAEAGSEAAARRRARGHPGAHRRGVSPLRRGSELRDVDQVRARRTAGHRRAHVLEDRRPRGHASRLRRRAEARSSIGCASTASTTASTPS